MLIVGTKGFAKELLEICNQNDELASLVFYDDISEDIGDSIYNQFTVIKSLDQAKDYFEKIDKRFTIGVGNPILRKKMYDQFVTIGGLLTHTISKQSMISTFDVKINEGCNILSGVNISNGVKIGVGNIVYYNVNIAHDCKIGDFVEISPSVNLLGHVKVGDFTHIGANATILPKLTIGNNVTVGAGAVVTRNIPDNVVVAGVPAKIIKYKELKV